jgi:DNA anti-recombination protein RmuC
MNPEIAILEQWFKLLNDRIHTLMGENGNLEDQVQDLTRQLQQVTLRGRRH